MFVFGFLFFNNDINSPDLQCVQLGWFSEWGQLFISEPVGAVHVCNGVQTTDLAALRSDYRPNATRMLDSLYLRIDQFI